MRLLFATISIFLVSIGTGIAQEKKSMVIGTLIDRPNALLVINPPGKNQGFLLPQLSTAERISISPSSPDDDGLVVFDKTEKAFYYWNNGSWTKGLGGGSSGSQSLSYDAVMSRLSISDGNTVNLETLKEIPSPSGHAGKYLTTNGVTLQWATIAALGDVTDVITSAGSGLSGGTSSGAATLVVNTDATTIGVNGSNQLYLLDNAVTTAKLADNSVTSNSIGDGEIRPHDIESGGILKVLATDALGAVVWEDPGVIAGTNQTLSVTGNTLSISGGNSVNLSVAGDASGPINNVEVQRIRNRDVSTLAPTSGDVLIWNGSEWAPKPLTETQILAIDPANFQGMPLDGDDKESLGLMSSNSGAFVFALGDSRMISAPVNLPHNARIDNITVYYQMTSIVGIFFPMTIRLQQKPFTGGAPADVSSISINALITVGVETRADAPGHIVDNSANSYRLLVTFSNVIDVDRPSTALQRIYGVRIHYTK